MSDATALGDGSLSGDSCVVIAIVSGEFDNFLLNKVILISQSINESMNH